MQTQTIEKCVLTYSMHGNSISKNPCKVTQLHFKSYVYNVVKDNKYGQKQHHS